MCVYIWMGMGMGVYVHMCVYLNIDNCVMYIYFSMCIFLHSMYVCVSMCACMPVCMCVYIFVCVCGGCKPDLCVWSWDIICMYYIYVSTCIWVGILGHDSHVCSLSSPINVAGPNPSEKTLPLTHSSPLPAHTTDLTPSSISERENGSSETTYFPGDHSTQVSPETWIMLIFLLRKVVTQISLTKMILGMNLPFKNFLGWSNF